MAKKSEPLDNRSVEEQIKEEWTAKAKIQDEKEKLRADKTDEVQKLLKSLPFQIFILVADADGRIDHKEFTGFKEFLRGRAKNCSSTYTKRMFHSTLVDYSDTTKRYLEGGIQKDIQLVFKAIEYIQKYTSEEVMIAIFKDLKELAIAIAEASGGILGITSPICKKEAAILSQMDIAFSQAIAGARGKKNVAK